MEMDVTGKEGAAGGEAVAINAGVLGDGYDGCGGGDAGECRSSVQSREFWNSSAPDVK